MGGLYGRIFLLEQLLHNKVDFRASDFEAPLQLQIEAKQKSLVDQLLLG